MAVAFDTSAAISATGTATVLLTATIANVAERVIFAMVSSAKVDSVSAITYAGVSLSVVANIETTIGLDHTHIQLYVQAAPATGTGTLAVAMTGPGSIGIALAVFNGVDQVTHYRTLKTASGSGTGVLMIGSSSSIDMLFTGLSVGGSAGDASITCIGATQMWHVEPARTHTFEGHRTAGAASTASAQWSFQASLVFAGFMVTVKGSAAAGPATEAPRGGLAMMGCGLKWITEELLPLPPFEPEAIK